jgi:hypothetical protein
MRCRTAELKRRVNGHLQLRFEAEGLTSFAGLELLRQYFSKLGLAAQIRRRRRSLWRLESIHTLRFRCLRRAGLLLRPGGHPTLDAGTAPSVKQRFQAMHQGLQAA